MDMEMGAMDAMDDYKKEDADMERGDNNPQPADDDYEKASDSPEKQRINEVGYASSVQKEKDEYEKDFTSNYIYTVKIVMIVWIVLFSIVWLICKLAGSGTEKN